MNSTATTPDARTDLTAALSRLAALHADYAGLLAACRASVAAAAAGHTDPTGYVRALLSSHGQLPARGAAPLVVLADARTALHLTGWRDGRARPDTP